MTNETVSTSEILEKILRQRKGFPEANLFINLKDWLNFRREFRRNNIYVKRLKRTHVFEVYFGLRHFADLCVEMNNRLPIENGKIFIHWKTPFEIKIEPRLEMPEIWHIRYGLNSRLRK